MAQAQKQKALKAPKPNASQAEGDRETIDRALEKVERDSARAKIIPFPRQHKATHEDDEGEHPESA